MAGAGGGEDRLSSAGADTALEEQRNGEWRYLEFLQLTSLITAEMFLCEIPGGTEPGSGPAPHGMARLLDSLRQAGAHDQATALAARAAARAALDDPDAVARLLDSLRQAGAHDQATALVDRLPAAGMFEPFLEQKGSADQFRFGREADGTPATP